MDYIANFIYSLFVCNIAWFSVSFCLCNHLQLEPLAYRRMDFEEFCAATISPYQLEAVPRWEEIASTAFEYFEQEGNRAITIEELAQVRKIYTELSDGINI